MLQKVDKSEIENLDEDIRQNVMITSEGEYVLAQADKKTWQKFQDQKNATDKAQKNVQTGDKELQELGLECPIDKRLFVDPMKTPCCGKTYCHECIENALLDNDLQCPNCQTENVSLERLEPDEDVKNKIKEYTHKKDGGSSKASSPKAEDNASRPGSRDGSIKSPKSPSSVAGKKRSASEVTETKDNLAVPAPAMKRQKSGSSDTGTPNPVAAETQSSTPNLANTNNVAAMPVDMQAMMQQMQAMPNMNGANMGFPGMMPFMPNLNMMNPMMMMGMTGLNGMANMNGMPNFNNIGGMPNMNGMDMNQGYQNNSIQNQNMNGNHGQGWNNNHYGNNRGGFRGGKKFNNNYTKTNSPGPQQPPAGLENAPKGPKAMKSGPPAGVPTGPAAGNKFSNQQRHQGNEEDNAYMRQPVNPQRAMNRDRGRRGMRNAEYKEL